MLTRIYCWFHRLTSRLEERGEYSSGYWQDRIRKEALILTKGLTSGRVLEMGCGEGLFLIQLAEQNPGLEIWGIDNSETRLSQAKAKSKEKNFENIKVSLQDAGSLSFSEGYFDAVVCINVFFNMASIDMVKQSLIQMRRVCKSSGKIIFDFRNSSNFLLLLKYKLARYYDNTVKNLPLNTYSQKQIESILQNSDLKIINKKFMGSIFKQFATVIIIEAKKAC